MIPPIQRLLIKKPSDLCTGVYIYMYGYSYYTCLKNIHAYMKKYKTNTSSRNQYQTNSSTIHRFVAVQMAKSVGRMGFQPMVHGRGATGYYITYLSNSCQKPIPHLSSTYQVPIKYLGPRRYLCNTYEIPTMWCSPRYKLIYNPH